MLEFSDRYSYFDLPGRKSGCGYQRPCALKIQPIFESDLGDRSELQRLYLTIDQLKDTIMALEAQKFAGVKVVEKIVRVPEIVVQQKIKEVQVIKEVIKYVPVGYELPSKNSSVTSDEQAKTARPECNQTRASFKPLDSKRTIAVPLQTKRRTVTANYEGQDTRRGGFKDEKQTTTEGSFKVSPVVSPKGESVPSLVIKLGTDWGSQGEEQIGPSQCEEFQEDGFRLKYTKRVVQGSKRTFESRKKFREEEEEEQDSVIEAMLVKLRNYQLTIKELEERVEEQEARLRDSRLDREQNEEHLLGQIRDFLYSHSQCCARHMAEASYQDTSKDTGRLASQRRENQFHLSNLKKLGIQEPLLSERVSEELAGLRAQVLKANKNASLLGLQLRRRNHQYKQLLKGSNPDLDNSDIESDYEDELQLQNKELRQELETLRGQLAEDARLGQLQGRIAVLQEELHQLEEKSKSQSFIANLGLYNSNSMIQELNQELIYCQEAKTSPKYRELLAHYQRLRELYATLYVWIQHQGIFSYHGSAQEAAKMLAQLDNCDLEDIHLVTAVKEYTPNSIFSVLYSKIRNLREFQQRHQQLVENITRLLPQQLSTQIMSKQSMKLFLQALVEYGVRLETQADGDNVVSAEIEEQEVRPLSLMRLASRVGSRLFLAQSWERKGSDQAKEEQDEDYQPHQSEQLQQKDRVRLTKQYSSQFIQYQA